MRRCWVLPGAGCLDLVWDFRAVFADGVFVQFLLFAY
jgi:hypothetical protein